MQQIIEEKGATPIHPYNHKDVISGQSTCTQELLEQAKNLDYIIAPVGGGGLLSGTLLACKHFAPQVKVIAGEPAGADDAYRSWKAGELIPQTGPNTIADGLLTSLGDLTYPIIMEHVEEIILVNDDAIRNAMKLIWERMKIIIEPSCAVPLAVVMHNKAKFKGKRIGLILTGGNVDLKKALELIG
jgi:threonine dehydratase